MPEITKQKDSRRIFIDTLIEFASTDERVILIVPDVGFNYIEEFQKRFPDRYFNFGVTEASTILIAAAMALDGWKPYVYSMINFVLFRPYEMVRNGIVKHKANVKLIGVKGSEGYKFLGFSHNIEEFIDLRDHGISLGIYAEDELFCKTIGLNYSIPKSNEEVKKIVKETYEEPAAAYIRL